MGLDFDGFVPANCCGMAGAFGFEAEHYDASIQAGEHKLLPAVREATPETLIIADGFSCREQIEQTTDRRTLHLAEVIHLAQHANGTASTHPEQFYTERLRFSTRKRPSSNRTLKNAGLWTAGAFVCGAVLGTLLSRR